MKLLPLASLFAFSSAPCLSAAFLTQTDNSNNKPFVVLNHPGQQRTESQRALSVGPSSYVCDSGRCRCELSAQVDTNKACSTWPS